MVLLSKTRDPNFVDIIEEAREAGMRLSGLLVSGVDSQIFGDDDRW